VFAWSDEPKSSDEIAVESLNLPVYLIKQAHSKLIFHLVSQAFHMTFTYNNFASLCLHHGASEMQDQETQAI
jgi:hypothetical protein